MTRYPQSQEHLYLGSLGATRRRSRAGVRRICASDVLPTAWLMVVPCMEYSAEDWLALPPIATSKDAALRFRETVPVDSRRQEQFMIMLLDAKNRVLGIDVPSKGGVDSAVLDMRLVFQAAILVAASAIILGHNHPSGEPTPSPEDIAMTQRIVQAGNTLSVRVLDHIVLGQASYASFADFGLMPRG